jgi:hypothetical protein
MWSKQQKVKSLPVISNFIFLALALVQKSLSISKTARKVFLRAEFPVICASDAVLVLYGGIPAGGVTGTDFDPSAGTQTITYTFTDATDVQKLLRMRSQ